MKVSELAKRVGIAPSAVRFYETEGILPSAKRNASGYRQYDEDDLCRLRVVVALRSLGLDLHEAGRLGNLCSEGHCDEMAVDLLPRVLARRAEIAKARAELDHLDIELGNLQTALQNGETQFNLCTEGSAVDGVDPSDCCAATM